MISLINGDFKLAMLSIYITLILASALVGLAAFHLLLLVLTHLERRQSLIQSREIITEAKRQQKQALISAKKRAEKRLEIIKEERLI